MKNTVFGLGLILTIISAFPIPSFANDNIATRRNSLSYNIVNITPYNLVNSAYQGYLNDFDFLAI